MQDTITLTFTLALLAIFLAVILAFWYRSWASKKYAGLRILNSVFLEVQVPRDTTLKDKEKEPVQQEKEFISVAEQLFTTLSHTEHRNFSTFLSGRDTFSFEIISTDKKISFVIVCPKGLQDLVEKQIHAQYPAAQIETISPPRVLKSAPFLVAAELGLQKKYIFPIKTYKLMESDPLNAITNSLSKLGSSEAGAIQMVISPASLGWRRRVLRLAKEIQKGKSVHAHTGYGMQFLHFISEGIANLFADKKKDQMMGMSSGKSGSPYTMLTPMQQDAVKRLEEKAGKSGFEVNIRLVVASDTKQQANSHLRNMLSSFMQYTQAPFNGFRLRHYASQNRILKDFVLRRFSPHIFKKIILNTEELTSIFHLPTKFTETPNIKSLSAKKAPPPVNIEETGLHLGTNIYRGQKTQIRIGEDDRRRHMYIIGRTGTGKSEFIKNMARQDIQNGAGIALVDPHGDLIEGLLKDIPKERADDVILFEPFDMERPMGLNMLEVKSDEEKDFAVQEMIAIFYKLFPPEIIGPMFEHNMRNVMLTLMADRESPGTLAEIPRMFTDPEFQKYKLQKVKDPVVRSFWEKEMAKTTDFHKSEMLGYLISKVGRFVENEMMRNIIGQSHSAFDFREVMDEGKILLVNLSKGKTGEVNAMLLGLIIVSRLQMAALARADIPESKRRDFYVYIDEFQNFVTDSIATILSEARKYHLDLIMAHQYIGQLVQNNDTKIRDAVFGNAGTMISFRIGVEDAEIMAKEFAPVFNEYDVINIDRFNAYVKLMINGTASRPFNMQTLPPEPEKPGADDLALAIKHLSKLKYGRARQEVEGEILERSRLGAPMPHVPGIERTI
ncbi:MAG: type IV secretion system DNA-binding domain-containing protein [bacterium]|nr:type IV secretion system DNA-binding domain-containing protein [bacterium]